MKLATAALCLCLLAGAWAAPAPAPAPSAPYARPLNADCVASLGGSAPAASLNYFPSPFRVSGATSTANGRVTVTVAKDFSVQYFDNYKVITNSLVNETYVLYQCGTPPPAASSLPAGAKMFSLPLTSVAALETVPVAFLNELSVMSRVQSVSAFAVNSCGQKLVGCGKTAVSGISVTPGILQSQVAPFADAALTTKGLPNASISIAFSAATDPGPLNRAEWLKFLGLFFNLDAVATQVFDAINSSYYQTKAAVKPAAKKPVLAFVSLYTYPPDTAFEVSLAPYKLNYTQDAGAVAPNKTALLAVNGTQLSSFDLTNNTVWFAWNRSDGTGFPSRAAATAAFQTFLQGVDIVVDETYAITPASYNLSTFLQSFNLSSGSSSSYPFLANKAVYREDGLLSPTNGLDWFEGALARPDRVLQDFAWAVNPAAYKDYKSVWLRNIAAGQNVTVVTSQDCAQLPSCSTQPAPICPFVKPCSSGAPAQQQSVNSTCTYAACSA